MHLKLTILYELNFQQYLRYAVDNWIFIQTIRFLQEPGLEEEAVMLPLHFGQQINLMVVLKHRRSFKNGRVKFFFSRGAVYCAGRSEVCKDMNTIFFRWSFTSNYQLFVIALLVLFSKGTRKKSIYRVILNRWLIV